MPDETNAAEDVTNTAAVADPAPEVETKEASAEAEATTEATDDSGQTNEE